MGCGKLEILQFKKNSNLQFYGNSAMLSSNLKESNDDRNSASTPNVDDAQIVQNPFSAEDPRLIEMILNEIIQLHRKV